MSLSNGLLSETVEGLDLAIRLAREQVAADPVLRRMSEELRRIQEREAESEPTSERGVRAG